MIEEIKGIKRSILGTIQFNIKCKGHKGFQNFICYPIKEKSDFVIIQSSNRIGKYYHGTGKIVLSKSRPRGSYIHHLVIDNVTSFYLSEKDKVNLNVMIRLTDHTDNEILTIDNRGALHVKI